MEHRLRGEVLGEQDPLGVFDHGGSHLVQSQTCEPPFPPGHIVLFRRPVLNRRGLGMTGQDFLHQDMRAVVIPFWKGWRRKRDRGGKACGSIRIRCCRGTGRQHARRSGTSGRDKIEHDGHTDTYGTTE